MRRVLIGDHFGKSRNKRDRMYRSIVMIPAQISNGFEGVKVFL